MRVNAKKREAIQGQMIGLIAGNLRELRKRGLSAADLLALEKLAILCSRGSGIVRVSALGRLLGIGRAGAHKRLARLTEKGFAVRVGRAVMLNIRSILAMACDAVKARASRAKELFSWQRSRKRFQSATDTRQEDKRGFEDGPIAASGVGDSLPDGRKIIGLRKHGLFSVPVWG